MFALVVALGFGFPPLDFDSESEDYDSTVFETGLIRAEVFGLFLTGS